MGVSRVGRSDHRYKDCIRYGWPESARPSFFRFGRPSPHSRAKPSPQDSAVLMAGPPSGKSKGSQTHTTNAMKTRQERRGAPSTVLTENSSFFPLFTFGNATTGYARKGNKGYPSLKYPVAKQPDWRPSSSVGTNDGILFVCKEGGGFSRGCTQVLPRRKSAY